MVLRNQWAPPEHRHHVADANLANLGTAEAGGHDVGAHQHLFVAQGIRTGARLAIASQTRIYSAFAPLMVLLNFQPPSGLQPCFVPAPSGEQRPDRQAFDHIEG